MTEKQLNSALIAACSALLHYQEFVDTGITVDRIAAESALQSPPLRLWLHQNTVMVPERRDGKTLLL